MLRIGQGFDFHRLVPGRKLILCGEEFEHPTGLLGHSDADVACHALMDALLGALALGDIGQLFPDKDARYLGIDSTLLLAQVIENLESRHVTVHNIDVTVIAERPKLAPRIPAMRRNLAKVLHLAIHQVSIKATTSEKMGFCGREEGIAASAVVLVDAPESCFSED